MTIKELKELIKDLPDNVEVVEGPASSFYCAGHCWAEVEVDKTTNITYLWIQH